jgi:hypothetical protein
VHAACTTASAMLLKFLFSKSGLLYLLNLVM